MPPKAVMKPSDAFMPRMSSGLVSCRHRMTCLAARGPRLGVLGEEDDPASGGPGAGGQALGQQAALLDGGGLGGAIEDRAQQLVQRLGLDATERLVLADELLVHHLDGDAYAGEAGALAVAALEHEQLLVLDGELDVLHLLVVLLELLADVEQLLVGLGKSLLELRDLLRGADAGDHVLALGVDQELTVEHVLAAWPGCA